MTTQEPVRVRAEEVPFPTYIPATPDPLPMFLEKRVYQGSSGRVYPLPFTDRIAETPVERRWKAVWIENEYLRVMALPEIGGRIHVAQDRTNGYDFIYRQTVIKPALVGLAGPWISGGIEFNWPQHHRPATFLPVDVHVEEDPDGSRTVWLGDHDPLCRMKGMHGIRLHPGKALLELRVRVHNRTPFPQTFLWWANAAARVHEGYQSFFPPDVSWVADHAKRATSEFPLCRGTYYGVDYGRRARRGVPPEERPPAFLPPHSGGEGTLRYAPNDLSWYANIPTPCSYMAMGSREDFFGGYDHHRKAGFVHIADHRIAPGKKQWTWGNHPFGYAWDRNLTDSDGPYIELMAGVFTDNQPDFSFLLPGETRSWSQYWYPIREIGIPRRANLDGAASLDVEGREARIGIAVSRPFRCAAVSLWTKGKRIAEFLRDLAPDAPFTGKVQLPEGTRETDLVLRGADESGREFISWAPRMRPSRIEVPPPASEPPPPGEVASADELFVTGLHLEQYRHATRCPTLYWREALRRDPGDARSNDALGFWHLRRGEFALAEDHFRTAIERLTRRNPNPLEGRPHYGLGLCLRHRLDALPAGGVPPFPAAGDGEARRLLEEALEAFGKAAWSGAWAPAARLAMAELACRRGDMAAALEHLEASLRRDVDGLRARDLRTVVLRHLDRGAEADRLLRETLALDPLDPWARRLAGDPAPIDAQTRLDLAHDMARAGFLDDAVAILEEARFEAGDLPGRDLGAAPLVAYTLGWLEERRGNRDAAIAHFRRAALLPPDHGFPARLEEIAVLEAAMRADPEDPRAPYYLGNLLYDKRRHREAVALWERSVRIDPAFAAAWRNLGIGRFNILRKPAGAREAFDRALQADPGSARIFHERDQLWKRLGVSPARRLRELEGRAGLVGRRDDLSVELCALLNGAGRHDEARRLLEGRRFQPWEGGEGLVLGQHVRTHLALGREALAAGEAEAARALFEAARDCPPRLGEARHLLANTADIRYWLGRAHEARGDRKAAREEWSRAAAAEGDFREMGVRPYSEMTYWSALALERLGKRAGARKLLRSLLAYAGKLRREEAKIDYFATSLPAMLLFEDDIAARQETLALFLEAQARLGLGEEGKARKLLAEVLRRDPAHEGAADLDRSIPLTGTPRRRRSRG